MTKKRKDGSFKNRNIDTVDWNDKGKAELWRQGIEQIPTVHMGVAATQMESKGIVTEKGEKTV